jgi:hypothetical protein
MVEAARRVGVGVALLGAALGAAVAACDGDDSTTPTGSGDHVVVDSDATTQAPQPNFDGGPDSIFAPVEGGAYSKPDGYDPYGACQSCKCPAGTYCFGGGGAYTAFSGNCMPSSFGVGCQPIPAACAAKPTCDCLLTATAAMVPCYGVCVQNSLTLYCPNP